MWGVAGLPVTAPTIASFVSWRYWWRCGISGLRNSRPKQDDRVGKSDGGDRPRVGLCPSVTGPTMSPTTAAQRDASVRPPGVQRAGLWVQVHLPVLGRKPSLRWAPSWCAAGSPVRTAIRQRRRSRGALPVNGQRRDAELEPEPRRWARRRGEGERVARASRTTCWGPPHAMRRAPVGQGVRQHGLQGVLMPRNRDPSGSGVPPAVSRSADVPHHEPDARPGASRSGTRMTIVVADRNRSGAETTGCDAADPYQAVEAEARRHWATQNAGTALPIRRTFRAI
jgi:hypothetical protein